MLNSDDDDDVDDDDDDVDDDGGDGDSDSDSSICQSAAHVAAPAAAPANAPSSVFRVPKSLVFPQVLPTAEAAASTDPRDTTPASESSATTTGEEAAEATGDVDGDGAFDGIARSQTGPAIPSSSEKCETRSGPSSLESTNLDMNDEIAGPRIGKGTARAASAAKSAAAATARPTHRRPLSPPQPPPPFIVPLPSSPDSEFSENTSRGANMARART